MVSIVLVTYNRAQRLKLSIQDILNQTFRDFELIICDDCSTDDTEFVCREFEAQDSRIRYIRHATNKRMPGNLNYGIEQARYEYIAILHDGDRFRRDLIAQWYNAISTHENVGFVFNSIGDTDRNEDFVKIFKEFRKGVVKKDELLKSVYFRRWQFDSPVWGEAMVRKSVVQRYGYLKEEFEFYADNDLWMEMLHEYDAYYCSDTLIKLPLKSFQPHLFQDDLIKVNALLFSMHLKHRKRAFQGKPLQMAKEMSIFYAMTVFRTLYCFLLIAKHETFEQFMRSRRELSRYPYLYLPWAGFLVVYPLVWVALKVIFSIRKKPEPGKKLATKSDFMFLV